MSGDFRIETGKTFFQPVILKKIKYRKTSRIFIPYLRETSTNETEINFAHLESFDGTYFICPKRKY